MAGELFSFTARAVQRISRAVFAQERDGGDRGGKRRRRRPREEHYLDIKLTGGTLITGAFNRWKYSWVEQIVVKEGTWQDKPAGLTSADTGWFAYNTIEANNAETGTQGNSINVDDLPAGSQIEPASKGTPVLRARIIVNCDGDKELHFSFENGVKPVCEEEMEEG